MTSTLPSFQDPFLLTVGAALLTHQVLRRIETQNPYHLSFFLLGVPLALRLSTRGNPQFPSAPDRYDTRRTISGSISQLGVSRLHFFSSLEETAWGFVVYWLTLAGSIVLYRLSPWHPLASFPGPMICRVSKLYVALLSCRGRQHVYYAMLHEKYGDMVRIGPNELIIRNPDAVASVIGPNGLPKGPFWDGRVPSREQVRPLIAIRDKAEHLRRRRPWTRAFSSAALKGYEPIVAQTCLELIDALTGVVKCSTHRSTEDPRGESKDSIDLTQWLSFFTYDVMNSLAFGGKGSMIRDGDVDGVWKILNAGQVNAIFMGHVPWLGSWILSSPWFGQDLKAFRAYAKQRAMGRRKEPPPYKDIFHHLMDGDGISSHPPSVVEMVNDGGLAIIAGADTSSAALANTLFFLMTSPAQYKRLQEEVDSLGEDVSDYAKLSQLAYLNATLNESLRLLPPVLTGSQRITEQEGRVIGMQYVPEGTIVALSTYSLQRDPRAFQPLPNTFLPERWLPQSTRTALEPELFNGSTEFVLNQNAFIPFSMGQANCVGKNLAWIEMRMCLALLVQRFDLTLDHGYDPRRWQTEIMDYFVTKKGPLPTVLKIRERES